MIMPFSRNPVIWISPLKFRAESEKAPRASACPAAATAELATSMAAAEKR